MLHVSCEHKGGMVIFVDLREPDKDCKSQEQLAFPIDGTPYKPIVGIPKKVMASLDLRLGATGILRPSHRVFDQKRSIHDQLPLP